jgi:acyl-coenzyme A synthetase/AMP-(fatty) acid ligase
MLHNLPTDGCEVARKAVPTNSAFVVFTSGSTGNPKGIVLKHTSLCSSAREHDAFIGLSTHSRVLQFAVHTFDISIGDIFATLIHGGCVCMRSEHERMNNLSGTIQAMEVNHVSLTVTVVSYLRPEDVPSLKTLVVAGEPLTRKVVEKWSDCVTLINMYGPAECTIYCIGKAGIRRDDKPSNIGRGVGALVWLADPQDSNSLTPIGTIGELLIEGPTLAHGYLGNKAHTESAFIENPSWGIAPRTSPPRRFYKTGDLARYNFDGSIDFVRRNDGQMKLHGQRLEIGKVEHQLRESLAESIEAAVSVVTTNNGQTILAAFLAIRDVIRETSEAMIARSPASLQHFQVLMTGVETRLQSILPPYIVPAVFVPISKLPLSTSGKIDRKRLQSITSELSFDELSSLRAAKATQSQPSTRMEKQVKSLWRELLQATEIGAHDNFFRLGGDSVTAIRLVAIARRESVALTVDQVFDNPVLADLALTCSNDYSKKTDLTPYSLLRGLDTTYICNEAISQCKIRQDQIEDIYPCTPQQESWIKQPLAIVKGMQAQVVFSFPRSLDLRRFRAAWRSVIRSEPILRTCIIHTASSGFFQVILKESIQWLKAGSLDEYLRKDKLHIISLGNRLQRLCIVEVQDTDERYFVWSAQHASYDGWALGLLFNQLESAYRHEFCKERPQRFNQFIEYISGINKNSASSFWRSHLGGADAKPLYVVPDFYTAFTSMDTIRTIPIPKCPGSEITVSTMIELSWSIVISRTLECSDVVFQSMRSGRNAPVPGIEEMIAPTVTLIPVRIHIDSRLRTQELLLSIQQFYRNVSPFERLGWNSIQELSDETSVLCKNAIGINIIPFMDTAHLSGGIGLDIVRSYLSFHVPFT